VCLFGESGGGASRLEWRLGSASGANKIYQGPNYGQSGKFRKPALRHSRTRFLLIGSEDCR